MKEKLYTIPLHDAMNAGDECPLCYCEREIEQDLLDFTLGAGASYMESDVRGMTDQEGFCREHFKELFDYGNTLGNAWILKTHYLKMNQEMQEQMRKHTPGKTGMLGKFRKGTTEGDAKSDSVAAWVAQKEASCFICRQKKDTYARYLDTFFYLWQKEDEFRMQVTKSKGFCLSHFGDLCEMAETALPDKQKEEFYQIIFDCMRQNMARMAEDVSWMVEKFDYANADADWKNSKDAIQRGMQKLKGGYPADAPYKMKK